MALLQCTCVHVLFITVVLYRACTLCGQSLKILFSCIYRLYILSSSTCTCNILFIFCRHPNLWTVKCRVSLLCLYYNAFHQTILNVPCTVYNVCMYCTCTVSACTLYVQYVLVYSKNLQVSVNIHCIFFTFCSFYSIYLFCFPFLFLFQPDWYREGNCHDTDEKVPYLNDQ